MDPDKFFDATYLPGRVELLEISKMKSEALQSCYAFWYTVNARKEDKMYLSSNMLNPQIFVILHRNENAVLLLMMMMVVLDILTRYICLFLHLHHATPGVC